jgi:hypothetical protein
MKSYRRLHWRDNSATTKADPTAPSQFRQEIAGPPDWQFHQAKPSVPSTHQVEAPRPTGWISSGSVGEFHDGGTFPHPHPLSVSQRGVLGACPMLCDDGHGRGGHDTYTRGQTITTSAGFTRQMGAPYIPTEVVQWTRARGRFLRASRTR